MTTKQIITEFTNHLNTLESLKALANKYDNTELVLTEDEWSTIKKNRINSRDWLMYSMTSDEWYNEMIESTKKIIKNN
tara:strand:+ start:27 stop:260 length:234 start_codon:yes stop_codon:yes gene_type:complete